MRIFLTGATGFLGTAIVPELVAAGHEVLGMTRSDEGAAELRAAGAEPHRGTLEDLDSLGSGAARSDGVIHCAFDHDFSRFVENCEKDKRAIEALGAALGGSDRLLLVTSGVGFGASEPGRLATEDVANKDHSNPRLSEQAGESIAKRGVKVAVVRLPQVHDTRKQGLITPLLEVARAKKLSAYVGEGSNRFAAAHVSDVAKLYRLAFEKQEAARYHAVAEEGIAARDIAAVLGRGLDVPVKSLSPKEVEDHFGFMSRFVGMDMSASSAWTRERLSWCPTGPSLIADLEVMNYAAAA